MYLFYNNETKFHGMDPEELQSAQGHGKFLGRSTFTLEVLRNKTELFKTGKSLQHA